MLRKLALICIEMCFILVLFGCISAPEAGLTDTKDEPHFDGNEVELKTPTSNDEKIILTLAYCILGKASWYEKEIDAFNNSQDAYEVVSVNYRPTDEITNAIATEQLLLDLEEGNGPDIIDISTFTLYVTDVKTAIYLQDLYPYIDADPELNREDFIQSFMEAYTRGGALYTATGEFGISTMVVAASVVDGNSRWGTSQLLELAERFGDGDKIVYGGMDKQNFLISALSRTIDSYVDVQNIKVDFDSLEYRQLLEFCDMLRPLSNTSIGSTSGGVVLFCDDVTLLSVPFYESLFNDNVVCVGAPNASGNGSKFTEPHYKLAMNSTGENKDGVWSFLRLFFTEDYQYSDSSRLPTNKYAMQRRIEDAKSGIGAFPSLSYDVSPVELESVTDEQIQQVLDLIETTSLVDRSYLLFDFIELAMSEAEDYLNGKRSLDEVIQSTQILAEQLLVERNGK